MDIGGEVCSLAEELEMYANCFDRRAPAVWLLEKWLSSMVWKENKMKFLVIYVMDVDAILEKEVAVCGSHADGGTYWCIKSEVPAPEGARLQAHMGSIFH